MHATHATEKTVNREAIAAFLERELADMPARNRACRVVRIANAPGHESIIVTCMDERNTHVDEALGFAPGEADVYASGGGKLDAATFDAVAGAKIEAAAADGRPVSVFLVPHECSHDANLGCAAFANDTEAQRKFFTELKGAIKAKYPAAGVHVMAFCTTTHKLRTIDVDANDARLRAAIEANEAFDRKADDVNHAGHGIYVGDAYRAWVPERNRYFRLSASNPNLKGNLEIALTVMQHHSDVDLSTTPVVLHVDYPLHADETRTVAARNNIDAHLAGLLTDPEVRARLDDGTMRLVRSNTDMGTWAGEMLE